jgi:hypothetical protein
MGRANQDEPISGVGHFLCISPSHYLGKWVNTKYHR